MRRIEACKVDAFTTTALAGNAAGVVTDAATLTDREMQQIAREMNVSETAFLLPATRPDADLRLRYFTPTHEIKLCGHATVAMFHRLQETGQLSQSRIRLETNVGVLDVALEGGRVFLRSDPVVVEPSPIDAAAAANLLGIPSAQDAWLSKRILFVTVDGLKAMSSIRPDLPAIAKLSRELDVDGIAPVSFETRAPEARTHIRYFVPHLGIDEDPVTGVAHMALAGYLVKLGRLALPGRFVGEQGEFCGRPGSVLVEASGSPGKLDVRIGGHAVTSLEGRMRLP